MSDSRVIFRHILPNCLSPIIVTGSLIVATIPGVAILPTVLAINLVGKGLNDALNPRLRNR